MHARRDRFRLILASASPRRRELLAQLGIALEVVAPSIAEPREPPAGLSAAAFAEALAYFKAAQVYRDHRNAFVLGADTLVSLGGRVIGKPADERQARRMLKALSGTRHEVITGLALLGPGLSRLIASETTKVTMRPMSRQELEAYLASGEWQGKAGAYAIQETADRYVEKIEGSLTNVVGLPMELTERMLRQLPPRPPQQEAVSRGEPE